MINLIKNLERGRTKIDWLESYHSFSFGEFYDPAKIHFGPLRVINDDLIHPGQGFPTHPHKDMEIVTIVIEGEVAHKDSQGNKEVIYKNEVQRMTAGSGIFHSEFNNSEEDFLKLYQIWILPNAKGLKPSYQQLKFSDQQKKNKRLKIVSGTEEDGVIFINQDVDIYLADFDDGIADKINLPSERGLYIHLIEGALTVNSVELLPGDAVKITGEDVIEIIANADSKIILFDVPLKF